MNTIPVSPRGGHLRPIWVAVIAVMLAMTSSFVSTAPAQAAQFTATTLSAVNIRSGPGTGYGIIKTLPKNARVGINCWKSGSAVSGPYGVSNTWYSVEGVHNGWITDSWIYTGRNAAVTSKCAPAPAPAPTSSLASKVDAFVAKHRGKKLDYDGAYGAQCVDLTNFYIRDVLKKPFIGVNYAYQTYAAASTAHYVKLGAGATPQKGDIAVWSTRLGGGYGHIAIVTRNVNSSTIEVFDQNWNGQALRGTGSPATIRTMSKSHLLGYLRPR